MHVADPIDRRGLERLVSRRFWLLQARLLSWPGGVAVSRRGPVAVGEDGFGLGVAVGLPGEHREMVGGEAVVVEAFAGEVVVDGAVGGFGGCPQRPLDVGEVGVGFGEGAEVFGPVIAWS
jgi:hypothetical protein